MMLVTRAPFVSWLSVASGKTYYELLRIRPDATQDAIKEAFHRFALACHPDRYVEEPADIREVAAEVFKRGVEAYRVLSRPTVRARYDRAMSRGKLRLDEHAASERPPAPVGKPLEDVAKTTSAKKFALLADRLLSVGKLDEARVQLITALQHEPDNAELSERLVILYEALALEPG